MSTITDFIPQQKVPDFFRKEHTKITRYLMNRFGVDQEKADEAFQNGCLALFDNLSIGKITKEKLTCSLSSYLTACCIRQSMKMFDTDGSRHGVAWDDFLANKLHGDDETRHQKLHEFLSDGMTDELCQQREDDMALLTNIVRTLPSPCKELIFGRYYDKLLMEELVVEMGLRNTGTARVALCRCLKKLRLKFTSLRAERQLIQ